MAENPAHSDNGEQLWTRVLQNVAQTVDSQSFETWFRPVVFAGLDQTSCKLVVPNPFFRRCFLDHYSDLLNRTIEQLSDAPVHLYVSTAEDGAGVQGHTLPVVPASALESETAQKPWLIEQLWLREAVGIVGGPPKLLKTWLALEMAVSVALRSPCLGNFPVHTSGPVLLFAAEDSQAKVRSRLQSLAGNHGSSLEQIDVRVITVDTLRLDRSTDQERLAATVMLYRPVLLVLDPLVRLHSLDENQSGPMAALLGYFRALQRKTGTAIVIVHHARKNTTSSAGAGYTLRGSGDLYAWVDSFICVQRRRDRVVLLAEHRSAPGLGPLPIELSPSSAPDQVPYLRLSAEATDETSERDLLPDRILNLLECSTAPLTTDAIRSSLRVRKQRVVDVLRGLYEEGMIVRDGNRHARKKPEDQSASSGPDNPIE
jgi:hypothetical protein